MSAARRAGSAIDAGSDAGSDAGARRRALVYLDHAMALFADHAACAPELINHLGHHHELARRDRLEPALNELERLGDRYACPRGYWLCLRQAAATMRLAGRLAGYDRRLGQRIRLMPAGVRARGDEESP